MTRLEREFFHNRLDIAKKHTLTQLEGLLDLETWIFFRQADDFDTMVWAALWNVMEKGVAP